MNAHPASPPKIRRDLVAGFSRDLSKLKTQPGAHAPDLAHALALDAVRARASDIHCDPQEVGWRLRFRVDGVICDVVYLTRDQGRMLVNQFKAMADLDPVTRFTPRDAHASIQVENRTVDLRLALAPCLGGEKLAIRILDQKQFRRSIKELGLREDKLQVLEDWLTSGSGMFLSAGPTGCGKTTTLYALLHELKFTDRAIVTLEDPVEYRLDGITQIQIDELHRLNYAQGAKAMLRLDPDYLMLGELRDRNSAQSAVNAAISGRVLMSTIHCRDAVGVLTALRNWGLADHELAESIVFVVSQRLVRKLCPHCSQEGRLEESDHHWLKSMGLTPPKRCRQPGACPKCFHLGYSGRTGIFELWRLERTDYELILQHAGEHALRKHLQDRGHASLLDDGLAKLKEGLTTVAELRRMGSGSFPSEKLSPRFPNQAARSGVTPPVPESSLAHGKKGDG